MFNYSDEELHVDKLKRSDLFFLERASIYVRDVMYIDMNIITDLHYKNEVVQESDMIYHVETVRSYT